jgi:hypothetical protein
MNEQTKENRALFLGWRKMHHLKILNSQFSKPPKKLITYKEKFNSSDFGPPCDAERFAQIDYWLANSAWKTARADAQSRGDIAFGLDHLTVDAQFEMRPSLRVHESKPSKKFLKPSPAQWGSFNDECSNYSDSNSFILQPFCLNKFVEGVLRAAENNLESAPTGKKKKYTSRNTWAKIEQRNQLRRHGAPSQEVRRLKKEIYKQARQDRQNI